MLLIITKEKESRLVKALLPYSQKLDLNWTESAEFVLAHDTLIRPGDFVFLEDPSRDQKLVSAFAKENSVIVLTTHANSFGRIPDNESELEAYSNRISLAVTGRPLPGTYLGGNLGGSYRRKSFFDQSEQELIAAKERYEKTVSNDNKKDNHRPTKKTVIPFETSVVKDESRYEDYKRITKPGRNGFVIEFDDEKGGEFKRVNPETEFVTIGTKPIITTKEEESVEPVEFKTVSYTSKDTDERRVLVKGVPGEKTVIKSIRYERQKRVSETVVSETVTQEPIDETVIIPITNDHKLSRQDNRKDNRQDKLNKKDNHNNKNKQNKDSFIKEKNDERQQKEKPVIEKKKGSFEKEEKPVVIETETKATADELLAFVKGDDKKQETVVVESVELLDDEDELIVENDDSVELEDEDDELVVETETESPKAEDKNEVVVELLDDEDESEDEVVIVSDEEEEDEDEDELVVPTSNETAFGFLAGNQDNKKEKSQPVRLDSLIETMEATKN